MVSDLHVLGVCLAGGQSRRMGQDKAQLKVGQETLLNLCKIQLTQLHVTEVVVSGKSYDIEDEYEDIGPLGGMYSTLKQRPDVSGYVFVPVDMPALSISSLKMLINHGARHKQSCFFEDHVLPCYVHGQEGFDYLQQVVNGNQSKRISGLLTHIQATALPKPTEQELINLNTPDAWRGFINSAKLA